MLTHPQLNAILALTTDASYNAIGAILEQEEGSSAWALVALFSKKLSPAQKKSVVSMIGSY